MDVLRTLALWEKATCVVTVPPHVLLQRAPRRSHSWHRSSKFFPLQTPADASQFEEAEKENRAPEGQYYVQVSM